MHVWCCVINPKSSCTPQKQHNKRARVNPVAGLPRIVQERSGQNNGYLLLPSHKDDTWTKKKRRHLHEQEKEPIYRHNMSTYRIFFKKKNWVAHIERANSCYTGNAQIGTDKLQGSIHYKIIRWHKVKRYNFSNRGIRVGEPKDEQTK